jgi:MFS family permease
MAKLSAVQEAEGSVTEIQATREDREEQGNSDKLAREKSIRRKVDLRLCSIAGLLCSLNLLDSGVISSASVTSMLSDLGLDQGNRYSVSIFIFTIASITFQLPSTIAVRIFGPRRWFSFITFSFGIITLCTAFVRTWRQMIALRILLGISMSGIYPGTYEIHSDTTWHSRIPTYTDNGRESFTDHIYPPTTGLTYLISTWYENGEMAQRFALLQSGEVTVLATGGIVNFGLNQLNQKSGLKGWQWMFIVQGAITAFLGIITYWWMVDFPENAHKSFMFLNEEESQIMANRST